MKTRVLLPVLGLVAAGVLVWGLVALLDPGRPDLGDGAGRSGPSRPEEPSDAPGPAVPAPGDRRPDVAGRVVDGSGEPVAGARVALFAPPPDPEGDVDWSGSGIQVRGSMRIDRGGAAVPTAEATSDGAGRFAFRTEAAGPFLVTASAEGFARAERDEVAAGTTELVLSLAVAGRLSGRVATAAGEPIEGAVVGAAGAPDVLTGADGTFLLAGLRAGRETEVRAAANGYEAAASRRVDIVAGERAELPEPLVLRPIAGITGRVFDPAGEPVEGAVVLAGGPGNLFQMRSGGATDLGGRYHLEMDRSAELSLSIRHPDYLDAETEKVRHEPGRRTIVPDVRLRAGGAVTGRILDESGSPVAGARPVVEKEGRELDMSGLLLAAFEERTNRTSGADGGYRVGGLEPGVHLLRVEADGYRPFVRRNILISGEETRTVDVVLERGSAVAGRVLDPGGVPLSGADVTVSIPREDEAESAPDFFRASSRSAGTVTDEEGRFRVTGLGEKPVTVQVDHRGYSSRALPDVTPGTEDLEIRLARTGSVSGRVVDDRTGEPVANVRVSVRNEEEIEYHQVASGEDGSFSIPDVPPGLYRLSAEGELHVPLDAGEVRVREGEETPGIELRLEEGEVLVGLVTRAADARPLEGAAVRLTGPVDRSVKTDGDGRFRVRGLLPGTYEATATFEGLAGARKQGVAVPAAGELRLDLTAGGTIRGRVRDADGRPVSGTMVVLGDLSGNFGEGQTVTDANGGFVFETVPAGERTVMVVDVGGGGFGMQTKRVTVVEGQESRVQFGGEPESEKARLTGRLLDRGEPLAGRMLILFPMDAGNEGVLGAMKMVTTDGEGRFDVSDLVPGRYAVLSGTMGNEMGSATTLEVSSAGEVRQDIELPAGRFSGIVTRADTGEPVQGARVLLADELALRRPIRSTGEMFALFGGQGRTNSEGVFTIPNASPGRAIAVVKATGLAVRVVRDILVSEEPEAPLTIRLERGSLVSVTVAGPGGAPVADAQVSLFADDGTWIPLGEDLSVSTAADGVARIRLPAGRWTVQVQASGMAPARREVRVAGDTPATFDLVPGGEARIVATAGGSPVAGAEVRVYREDGTEIWRTITEESLMAGGAASRTGEDGRLAIANLPPGDLRLVVTDPAAGTAETTVRIRDGEPTDVALELK